MSLRRIHLDELNVMAKRNDSGFAAKAREVMVDRHPATLDPHDQDPVATVALAWEEVAPRGRSAFERFAEKTLREMDGARLAGDPSGCDWPLAHAVCRLLLMLRPGLAPEDMRARCARTLAGLVVEREEFLTLVGGRIPKPGTFWMDAFRVYLAWHGREPAWLGTLWHTALHDEDWPPDEGACLLLENAAANHPEFVTVERLALFWKSMRHRGDIADLKRWFYLVGANLESSPAGISRLLEIQREFGGHLQDFRHNERGQPWDMFVTALAAMFRNPRRQQDILSHKTPSAVPVTTSESYRQVPDRFLADPSSIERDLLKAVA